MAFSLPGISVPHRKNTSGLTAVKMDTPKTVTIPTVMHIGKPAIVKVNVGDTVHIGTLLAEADGKISSSVFSSVSGNVKKIEKILMSNGRKLPAITIESDNKNTIDPSINPPIINSKKDLISALKNSGIVGLGGAGFPTHAKFDTDKPIDQLIINGAECEPYITSDSVTMVNNADDIALAIQTLQRVMDIKEVIIGIEKNKPEAITAMRKISEQNKTVKVCALSSRYPQGGEKVLIYHTTKKVVPRGALPIEVGCVVANCSTVASMGKFFRTGMPLTERLITVDGDAVKEPKNIIAPVGTSLKDVFEFCGGFKAEPLKVLYGGPMMGIAVPDMDVPVLKNTNAVLAFSKSLAIPKKTTACIKCGACINVCPFGINPPGIHKAYKTRDINKLLNMGADLCMECGCCSYVCPANRPLVQNNKLAKAFLREDKAENNAKETAN